MRPLTRRRFVQGAAGAAGMLTVAGGLRYLEDASEASAGVVGGQALEFRTGHSNNCDGACGHLVRVVDGRVRLIQGAPWDSTTIAGQPAPKYPPRSCLRGVAQIQNTYSPDRLKYPYQRVGERGSGQWRRISWDDATSLIAENFERVQTRYGKKSVWIAPYTGSLALLEGVVGAGFRLASVIGASAGDFEGDNEGDSSTPAGWNYVLADPDLTAGGIFDGHEMTDFLNAKAIVLWANNVAETSIPDWRIIADAHKSGTTVVSIDPRFTPTSAKADIWLPVRPGADTALIDGVMNYVLQRRLYDASYVKQYTVAPFLVDTDTKLFLRKNGSYLVIDAADGQLKPIQHAKDPDLYGEHDGAQSALTLLTREMAPYTPQKVAAMTDLHPEQVLQLRRAVGPEEPARGTRRVRAVALGARRSDHAGAGDAAGTDGEHRRTRWRHHHLCGWTHDDRVRPPELLAAGGDRDVHGARADGGVRRDARGQALPGAGRVVHGR
jgi:anaerobic selenocysteine-containing dehydrogenase